LGNGEFPFGCIHGDCRRNLDSAGGSHACAISNLWMGKWQLANSQASLLNHAVSNPYDCKNVGFEVAP
jgi:hypothetical protein